MVQTRITLDWDKVPIKTLTKIIKYRNLAYFEMRSSSTKGNCHVIVWLLKPVSDRWHFELRKRWKDDTRRIWLDKKRIKQGLPIQVLFRKKRDYFYKVRK